MNNIFCAYKKPGKIYALFLDLKVMNILNEYGIQELEISNNGLLSQQAATLAFIRMSKLGISDNIEKDFKLMTLEGMMEASYGDYLVQGMCGEFYFIRKDVFASTYERRD